MSLGLILGSLFFSIGIPIAIISAIFAVRGRKLQNADDIARRTLEPLAAELRGDDRVTVEVRAGRKENERYHNNGRGPIYATLRVAVDLAGLSVPLRLRPHRMVVLPRARQKLGLLRDVEVGAAAFDEAWVVEAEPALAKELLTPEVTSRLNALLGELPDLAKIEVGPTGLCIEWTAMTLGKDTFFGLRGNEPRWTTADPTGSITRARDVLLDLRARLLARAEERAIEAVGGGSYRARAPVRVEVAEPVRVEVDEADEADEVDELMIHAGAGAVARRSRKETE